LNSWRLHVIVVLLCLLPRLRSLFWGLQINTWSIDTVVECQTLIWYVPSLRPPTTIESLKLIIQLLIGLDIASLIETSAMLLDSISCIFPLQFVGSRWSKSVFLSQVHRSQKQPNFWWAEFQNFSLLMSQLTLKIVVKIYMVICWKKVWIPFCFSDIACLLNCRSLETLQLEGNPVMEEQNLGYSVIFWTLFFYASYIYCSWLTLFLVKCF